MVLVVYHLRWNDKVKELVLNCSQLKKRKIEINAYKNSATKNAEIEKLYKSGRKSINKMIQQFNDEYFHYRHIDDSNIDKILDKILDELQVQIETSQRNVTDEDIKKICIYSYPNSNKYCGLAEIDDLIKTQIKKYWEIDGTETWKCTDDGFCNMIYLCLQGLVDRHITQRHIHYNRTKDRCIEFTSIKEILDSNDTIKRKEEYYLFNIKSKLLSMCEEFHNRCVEGFDSDEEREKYCQQCEISAFHEYISAMNEDEIKRLVHTINPNVLAPINELNWAEYCNTYKYNNVFFKGLRDINAILEKDKDYISYIGKDKKINALTTVVDDGINQKALMRACRDIVQNPNLYEVMMDASCLISKDLETESIYDGAGDYLKDFKIEEEHIYHCKNVKMKTLGNAIKDIGEK